MDTNVKNSRAVCHNVRRLFLGVLVSGLLLTSPAVAVDFPITVGHESGTSDSAFTASAGDTFQVNVTSGRSYACTAHPTDSATEFDFSMNVTDPDSATLTANTCGDVEPKVTVIGMADTSLADNRLCFTPTMSGVHVLSVETAKGGGEVVRVECVETTLFGAFNTNVNDFNFLELENTTTSVVTAKVSAFTNAGSTLLDAVEVTIQPGARNDVDIHSAAGTNVFGPIRVTHDGPIGALQGRTSFYTGSVTNFNLNGQTELRTRADGHR